jgi:hypothetical protein
VSCDGCCDAMGHFCLAVLSAITALAVALIFAVGWRRPWELGSLLVAASMFVARAPPVGSVRFTQLCVLRR